MGYTTQDPIADLLTRLRNAGTAKKRYFDVRHSQIKENIIKVLQRRGFVAHYLVKQENKQSTLRVFLRYSDQREHLVHEIKRVSKCSLRKYVSAKRIPSIKQGLGMWILSTNRGIVDSYTARKENIGGEILLEVW